MGDGPQRAKKPWYEKYRHFITSDGMVAVAASAPKDVEFMLSRKTATGDLVFHADFADAGWVVLKSGASQVAIKECVEFAAALSPWSDRGADVFCVKPEQLAKRLPTGELLAKGYFFASGNKLWFKNVEQKLSIGIKIGAKLVSGPVMAVHKAADYFVTLVPSATPAPKGELVGEIRNRLLLKARPEHKAAIEAVEASDIEKLILSDSSALAQ